MGGIDLLVSVVKVVGVFGLLFVTLRLLSRSRGLRGEGVRGRRTGPVIEVLDKTRVGRSSSVVTVRVGGRALLLGVTENQVSTLADVTDTFPIDDAEPDPDVTEPHSVMEQALELIRSGRIR